MSARGRHFVAAALVDRIEEEGEEEEEEEEEEEVVNGVECRDREVR